MINTATVSSEYCPVCGRWFEQNSRHPKIYCSAECRTIHKKAKEKLSSKIYICEVCGSSYRLKQGGSRLHCPDCYRESKTTSNPKPKPAPRLKSLDDYAREADECGLSYGKYKVALKLGKTYEQLKAEYERLKN